MGSADSRSTCLLRLPDCYGEHSFGDVLTVDRTVYPRSRAARQGLQRNLHDASSQGEGAMGLAMDEPREQLCRTSRGLRCSGRSAFQRFVLRNLLAQETWSHARPYVFE